VVANVLPPLMPVALPLELDAEIDASAEEAAFEDFDESVQKLEDFEDSMEAESEQDSDPFAMLELEASVSVLEGMGDSASLEATLAAEMESTQALTEAMNNFLSASDSAMEHTATEALDTTYGRPRRRVGGRRKTRRIRRPYMGENLRNVQPLRFPRQLMDFGYEPTNRDRAADILAHRPRQSRFSRGDIEAAKKKWDQTRATYQKLYNSVYQSFENLCGKRMPLAYAGYCQEMMRDYRYIAQGIQYGDKATNICMNGNWCDRKSYVRHAVHAYFVRESGDV